MPRPGPNDIEEGGFMYRPGGLHPVYIGDLFNNGTYEVLCKLGYDEHSTEWLVMDRTKDPDDIHRFMALKIAAAEDEKFSSAEIDILADLQCKAYIEEISVHYKGLKFIRHLFDDFTHDGPNGTHACLVFEPMIESLETFHSSFREGSIPLLLMQRFTAQIALALGRAHWLGIIHADVQPSSIYVKFQSNFRIASKCVEVPVPGVPHQDRSERCYTPIKSTRMRRFYFRGNVGPPDKGWNFDVCLGGWGHASRVTSKDRLNSQPIPFLSPEVREMMPMVLIGAPWDTRTDWWSLGVTLIEIFAQNRRHPGASSEREEMNSNHHLLQMQALFGHFRTEFLQRGDPDRIRTMFNGYGRVLSTSSLGGWETRPQMSNKWQAEARCFKEAGFWLFVVRLMQIHPEDRPKGVGEVLRDRWIMADGDNWIARELADYFPCPLP
ncbi:kinase-like domain-containing protein [Podospora conica]|nr:kinase-like domain-containing protein [Schizothecium conicum]